MARIAAIAFILAAGLSSSTGNATPSSEGSETATVQVGPCSTCRSPNASELNYMFSAMNEMEPDAHEECADAFFHIDDLIVVDEIYIAGDLGGAVGAHWTGHNPDMALEEGHVQSGDIRDIATTMLHEAFHHINPEWSEMAAEEWALACRKPL